MDKIDEFIEQHNRNYTCYCEVLILKDGTPIYANPSHQYKLMEVYGVPRKQYVFCKGKEYEELQAEMPLYASPLHWLVEKTQTVAVWWDMLIFPMEFTREQISTVGRMISAGCIDKKISLDISHEYTICNLQEVLQEIRDKLNRMDYEVYEKNKFKRLREESFRSYRAISLALENYGADVFLS